MIRTSDDNKGILNNMSLEDNENYTEIKDERIEKKLKKTAWIHKILLNRTIRVVGLTAAIAICLPTLMYMVFYSRELSPTSYVKEYGTCGYYDIYHLPCGPKNVSENICKLRGCCYMYSHGCYHSLPSRHRFLASANVWSNDVTLTPAYKQTPLDGEMSVDQMKLIVNEVNENVAEIVLSNSPNEDVKRNNDGNNRVITNNGNDGTRKENNYNIRVFMPSVYVEIYRKNTNVTLFTSAKGPWIASPNYFEWSMHLNADIMIGFGHHFLDVGHKYLLFNNKSNFAVPFVLGFNKQSSSYHGVYFSSESPVEVEIMDTKLIIVRGHKSSLFRVSVLIGPTPQDIYTQIKALTGKQYALREYWQLGIHLCDTTRNLTLAVSNLEKLLTDKKYPFDSHCVWDNLIWLTNNEIVPSEIRPVLKSLRDNGKYFIASVMTPLELGESAAYSKAQEQKLLLSLPSSSSTPYVGSAYGKNVSYIDFTLPESKTWLNEFWSSNVIANIDADGFLFQATWLPDDSSFVSIHNNLPYVSDLMNDTMRYLPPWNVMSREKLLLLKQNQIPEVQVNQMVSDPVMENKMLLTTTPSINVNGVSFRQSVSSTWKDFGDNIKYLVGLAVGGYNLYGFPVCGDYLAVNNTNDVSEELCIRWYQFASVMPIFRLNSNRFIDNFSLFAQRTMINIIRRRYTLLEYMFSTLNSDNLLLRPIIYDFPEQFEFAENYTNQFMIGDSLMVVPVTLPLAKYIPIYFPDTFYELWGGMPLTQTRPRKPVKVINYPIVLTDFPIFLRAGKIIALHNVQQNTQSAEESRRTEFYLKVGLKCTNDNYDNFNASGILMFTQQTMWKFVADNETLTITLESNDTSEIENLFCTEPRQISNIIEWADIYGLNDTINEMPMQSKRIMLKSINVCETKWNEPLIFPI